MLEKWMKRLAKELEVEEIPKAEVPGVFAIPLDEEVTVLVAPLPEKGFALTATLGECPTRRREQFLALMMDGNLFAQGTRGASLGLDDSGKNIVLTQYIDYDTDEEQFLQIVEDFMNACDLWRAEVQEHHNKDILK